MSKFNQLSGAIRFALFASASALVATSAYAQDAEKKDEAKALDTIEVTGSHLKRAAVEGATPVIVIDRAQLDATGDVSVADVMRDSTFASFGNFKPQSGSSAQSLASIDLRGLSSGRTLVLIDGRRAPTNPMSASSGADLNAIPLAAVERIEILSDGASAVYGSDAIGGVVNIILRKDFNGAELRYGLAHDSVEGGDLEEMSAVFGTSNDTTRLIGGASKSSRGMVFTRDQIGGGTRGVTTYGNNYFNWDTYRATAVPGFDCTQGAFYVQSNGRCSFNFNSVAANEASVDNKALFARGDHQINDDWTIYFGGTITKVETFGRYAPVPGVVRVEDGTPNDINSGVICGTACTPGVDTDGLPTYFYHRFAAAGNRDNFTDTTNSDFLVGFQGQLTDTISVDFGARRTDYKFIELGRGYIVSAIANQFANDGSYDLSDPYGADPAVLSGMTATINRESRWTTDELYALFNADLFEMNGGMSVAAFGVEYRKDDYYDRYDSLSEGGQVLGSAGNSSAGGRTAKAAYFEWLLPFASNFDITVAGRYDKYSDYGSDFSPKVSLRWQAMDSLTFRASYGNGFRAPGLDILTAQPTFSAEPISNDPQSCLAAGLEANCDDPSTGDPSSIQVDTTFISNPNLASEQSSQYSAGLVWDVAEWMDVSLDYYNIKVDDAIEQISPSDLIYMDLDPATYGNVPAGFSVVRNPVTGAITDITAGYANIGVRKTDGLDFRVNTDFDMGGWGKLENNLIVSYIMSYKVTDVSGLTTEQLGLLGAPDMRAQLNNTWSKGDWTVSFNTNYIKGQDRSSSTVGGYTTHDVQLSWKAPWDATVSIGATNVFDRYPELVAFDGRPWNFYLYDAYGRTNYFRYTQSF